MLRQLGKDSGDRVLKESDYQPSGRGFKTYMRSRPRFHIRHQYRLLPGSGHDSHLHKLHKNKHV